MIVWFASSSRADCMYGDHFSDLRSVSIKNAEHSAAMMRFAAPETAAVLVNIGSATGEITFSMRPLIRRAKTQTTRDRCSIQEVVADSASYCFRTVGTHESHAGIHCQSNAP